MNQLTPHTPNTESLSPNTLSANALTQDAASGSSHATARLKSQFDDLYRR